MNQNSFTKRAVILLYGVAAYAAFLFTISYATGFVGNFVVPKSIDSARTVPFLTALLVNAGLLALFAVQHSVMARPFFKRWITRHIPESAERSTFTLAASIALLGLFWLWEPMGGVVWQVENPVGRVLFHIGCAFGWVLVLLATFLINHFDLFGLRQVWLQFRNRPYTALHFNTPGPYKLIRHPLYLGFIFAFWCTPTMTVAHLFFAVATAAYILVAIQLEERDLQAVHPEYADYKRRTPMLVPRVTGKGSAHELSRSPVSATGEMGAEG